MNEYRYSLIRYIANPKRMEPQNVGVLLQGSGSIDFRLNPHASKRGDIETPIFQQWREFLRQEIKGPETPLFQPARSDVEFLRYLSDLCESTVVISPPYQLVSHAPFESVLASLYDELVAPPEATRSAATRPAGKFRQLTDDRELLKRGMKGRMYLSRGDSKYWMAYRQVSNGTLLAVDKVEVDVRMGETANEIERLPNIERQLKAFLERRKGEKATRFVLLADELSKPFRGQSNEDFAAMQENLESAIKLLKSKGAEIVRTIEGTVGLADEIDTMLPSIN